MKTSCENIPAPSAKVASETPQKAGLRKQARGRTSRAERGTRPATKSAQAGRGGGERRRRSAALPQPAALPRWRREDEPEERAREADQPAAVEPRRLRVGDVRDQRQRQRHRRRPDRHVDEEDPLPAEDLGDKAAGQRPDRNRAADRRAPGRDRGAALRSRELLADQGKRRREHRRPADPLDRAGGDQQRHVASDPAEREAAVNRTMPGR